MAPGRMARPRACASGLTCRDECPACRHPASCRDAASSLPREGMPHASRDRACDVEQPTVRTLARGAGQPRREDRPVDVGSAWLRRNGSPQAMREHPRPARNGSGRRRGSARTTGRDRRHRIDPSRSIWLPRRSTGLTRRRGSGGIGCRRPRRAEPRAWWTCRRQAGTTSGSSGHQRWHRRDVGIRGASRSRAWATRDAEGSGSIQS